MFSVLVGGGKGKDHRGDDAKGDGGKGKDHGGMVPDDAKGHRKGSGKDHDGEGKDHGTYDGNV